MGRRHGTRYMEKYPPLVLVRKSCCSTKASKSKLVQSSKLQKRPADNEHGAEQSRSKPKSCRRNSKRPASAKRNRSQDCSRRVECKESSSNSPAVVSSKYFSPAQVASATDSKPTGPPVARQLFAIDEQESPKKKSFKSSHSNPSHESENIQKVGIATTKGHTATTPSFEQGSKVPSSKLQGRVSPGSRGIKTAGQVSHCQTRGHETG